jgi:hypothetical protein
VSVAVAAAEASVAVAVVAASRQCLQSVFLVSRILIQQTHVIF